MIPPWDASRQRTLSFQTPINAPAMITNLVGSDCINVAEAQIFTVKSENCIKLESKPVPQIAGASNFQSLARITMQDIAGAQSGCTVTAVVQVTALGPWGLTGTIESFMVNAAKDSLRQFFNFCGGYISELISDGELEATLRCVPEISEILETQIVEEGESSEFFDAEESSASSSSSSGLPPIDFEAVDPAALGEVFALYLQYLSRSADETTALLHSIDARLARLEEQNRSSWSSLGRLFSWESYTYGSRQWWLLLGLGTSTAALTALMYRSRSKQSNV